MTALKALQNYKLRWWELMSVLEQSQEELELDNARAELEELNCILAENEIWLTK
jgi:hypothetical protein